MSCMDGMGMYIYEHGYEHGIGTHMNMGMSIVRAYVHLIIATHMVQISSPCPCPCLRGKGRCANTAPRQRFANKPCLLPLPDSCSRRRRAASLTMITRILRSIPLAITALACLASTARAADEAKNDYGTVIGIGTRFYSLTALNSSSSH